MEFVTIDTLVRLAKKSLEIEKSEEQRETELLVLQHIHTLLQEGKTLTMDEKDEIKLWDDTYC